ncbi:MAG: hypothetical protein ND895_01380 [Pyrinomonadaceae bacterium]|nr:hypothetical protein [Pyrinomonadaceae bacterium]
MASLKWILLYTAFGTKLDARDWMDAKVFPAEDQDQADLAWKTMYQRDGLKTSHSSNAEVGDAGKKFWQENGEFWFDYISDTGDGMTATYSIAYLCLSNLWVKELWPDMPDDSDAEVHLDHKVNNERTALVPMPRGEFLLVGGDTCYHLSDYSSLHIRFQTPFSWAYQDLEEDLKTSKKIDEQKALQERKNRRPLFGIPGNHDYYDMLDGFRRQFRFPIKSRPENKTYAAGDLSSPQLMIPGFIREQQTSYLSLRLPFGWELWGLDTEVGKIDDRQRDFFLGVPKRPMPEKLIVATSAPTTVFGKLADREDEKSSKAFYQLSLPRPFLPKDKLEEGEKDLEPTQIRLDLAGDVHQYARYWGPDSQSAQFTRFKRSKAPAPSAPNYASVVSGLGGAFHHPSTTYVDEVREQALYPPEDRSRHAVADEIFNPIKVARGGGIWVLGGVMALVLAFAAIAGESSRPAIHNFLPFTLLNITSPQQYESTILVDTNAPQKIPIGFSQQLGIPQAQWTPSFPTGQGCSGTQKYLWGKCSVAWPIDYWVGTVMLMLTMVIIGFTFYKTEQAYALDKKQDEVKDKAARAKDATEQPTKKAADAVTKKVNWALWPTLIANIILGILGVLLIMPYREFITPFGSSLWVLVTLIWAITSVVFSIRYSDWLFEQASRRKVGGLDYAIIWMLALAALASLAVGLAAFGKSNLPAYLVSDIVFVTVVVGSLVLMIYAGVTMGGQFQKGLGKWGMGLLGFWHWLLQLGVALFLIKKGTWLTVALAIVVVLAFIKLGPWLMRGNRRWGLVAGWLVFGGIMLALPPLVYQILVPFADQGWVQTLFLPHDVRSPGSFASYEWWGSMQGWWMLVPIGLTSVFGALLSCVWVSWYFAVCLGFNGHNNEAGGAARIERFKQFIRFRLTESDLTGYVIAIDEPQKEGRLLSPRVIDVFRLVAKKP